MTECLRFIFGNTPAVFVDLVRSEKRAFSEECTIGSGGYCVRLKRTEQGYLRHLETGFLFKTYKGKKGVLRLRHGPGRVFNINNNSKIRRVIVEYGKYTKSQSK
jgi:hypothetical protein